VIPTSNCKLSFRGLKHDSQNRLIPKLFTQSQSDTVLDHYTKFFKNFMKDIFHVCRMFFLM
jgi:hypothetical protein